MVFYAVSEIFRPSNGGYMGAQKSNINTMDSFIFVIEHQSKPVSSE